MTEQNSERRRHKHFRILHIDLPTFLRRFVLREKPGEARPGAPDPAISPALRATPHGTRPPVRVDGLRFASRARNSALTTGLPTIDRQHQQLMDAMLKLQQALRDGSGLQGASESMESVSRHAEEHFEYEEAFMEHVRFPHLGRHRREHEHFKAQVQRLRQQVAALDTFGAMELSAALFQWQRDHILGEDLAYAEHARKG
jgi:hemerythrin